MKCNIIKSARNVKNRLRINLPFTKVNPTSSANGADVKINSNLGVANRWTYSLVRCEYCARVDLSILYLRGTDELRKCTYQWHGDFPPDNAIIDEAGQLYVSPTGTTCYYFLSRAW